MAQIVPIKIKIGTDMYREWSRQHKHEGRGIPIVYIVRADGKTLYAKSGKPQNEVIGQMLTAALDDAGYIMTERDVSVVEKVTKTFRSYRENGEIAAAVRSLRKAKNYLDDNGNVASYAASAADLQKEIDELLKTASTAIEEAATAIDAVESDDAAMIEALEKFEQTKTTYSSIKSLKRNLSKIQASINKDPRMKKNQSGLKIILSAESAKSSSSKQRSVKRLEALISDAPSEVIKSRAQSVLAGLKTN